MSGQGEWNHKSPWKWKGEGEERQREEHDGWKQAREMSLPSRWRKEPRDAGGL